ncbi:CoA-transferase family III family protein 12 [Alloalcanivorax dieselolei B5]|uniref:CoA-transferase family III family protein 12 n=2 Tax=Alloalcanivorax dieselolei TaxID=285091 RepID=K0CLH6_ALCDB|nr:CoA-transferase family III family protein 12 [Alloalcanivorax dieselolei B5]
MMAVGEEDSMSGPLKGLKIIEMVGIGPGPFCSMMFADMGAEVIRIDRPGRGEPGSARFDVLARGRRSLALDLKKPGAADLVLDLVEQADVLIEGFRPGVMEKMGLGPEVCLRRRPSLVFGRMTGWGQFGPLSSAAGHDLNYIALTGALHGIGRADGPPPPLNYVGDFGGGAMMLAFGILAAVYESRASGQGQVVDAAMTDGAALLSAMMYGMKAAGAWRNERSANLLDGAAPYYDTYQCADGKFVAVGAIEPQFYAELLKRAEIDDPEFEAQNDRQRWPSLKTKLTRLFASQPRDYWCERLEGSDACFAPVLDWEEAPQHPHNRARHTFITVDGVVQPAPAPRFSRTPPPAPRAPSARGQDSEAVLSDWGIDETRQAGLRESGIL